MIIIFIIFCLKKKK